MIKRILLIFTFAVYAGNCFGAQATQTNSPVTMETNLPPQWDGSVALGLTATAGNSDSVLFTGKFQTHKKSPWNEFALGLDATYGETDSTKNNETLHGFGQYNHLFDDRWYGYARADALHDGIADVKYRFTFGPGVGYYFIKTAQTSLAGEFGPGILYEKLDGGYNTYATLRLAERFEHKFNDRARLWQKVEFLPEADKPDKFLVSFEIGMETALTQKISMQIYLDDDFANQPAPGRKENDVKLVSGLSYKF